MPKKLQIFEYIAGLFTYTFDPNKVFLGVFSFFAKLVSKRLTKVGDAFILCFSSIEYYCGILERMLYD